jgi:HSP20 family protein
MKTGKGLGDVFGELSVYRRSGWQPKADVYRCADGWLVKLELAGVAKQDLRITIQDDLLVVEGRRRDWSISDTQTSLSMEINYDWFRRSIRLPASVTAEDISTEYRDGMLLIYLRAKG